MKTYPCNRAMKFYDLNLGINIVVALCRKVVLSIQKTVCRRSPKIEKAGFSELKNANFI